MSFSSYKLGLIAAFGSLMLLSGAFFFQFVGYQPCAMCLWQRYPHAVAIFVGLILFIGVRHVTLLVIGMLAAITTSSLGLFHTGVERGWWEGPTSCTGSSLSSTSQSLLPSENDTGPGIVMCDEVVWQFLTLSMASWNAILSVGLFAVWMLAIMRASRRSHI